MCSLLAGAAMAATFGTVLPIGGQPSDLALDEARGLVYVANYTANRIEVISIQDKRIQRRIPVAAQPASLALSPDGRYLVIAHLSNFKDPLTPENGLTVLDLTQNTQRKFTFASAPMGVAFTGDGLALIATATEFLSFNPATGTSVVVADVADVVKPKELPQPLPTPPREIIRTSMSPSGDGKVVWGAIEIRDQPDSEVLFLYDAASKTVNQAIWKSSPNDGPRVISVSRTGDYVISGWGLYHASGYLLAQFPDPLGKFAVGGHAFDSDRGTIYAQVPGGKWTKATPPVLNVLDADNLTVREQLKLRENLSGRALMSADGSVMYAVSESGLSILPVGSRNSSLRVAAAQEDLVFRGQWCDRRVITQTLDVADPGGNKTDFTLKTDMAGVTFSPSSGTTPAHVQVSVDPSVYVNVKGTATGTITIESAGAVNVPETVRILVNNHEPDQRGAFFNVPGKVVDLLADPARNRFYVLRQDKNQVLVYDAGNIQKIATLRTGNTPWSMAITTDQKTLITGADNSQVAHTFNLDTLQPAGLVVLPGGHYPRWIAASNTTVLAASRVAGPKHTIDWLDLAAHTGTTLPTLGVWENDINIDTALVTSPSGRAIFGAMADGRVMLYDIGVGQFVAAAQPVDKLSGVIAALSDQMYIAGNEILNESLGPLATLDGTNLSSGFAAVDGTGVRTTAPNSFSPGMVSRVDLYTFAAGQPTRMVEAPLVSSNGFVRGLAPLSNGQAIVSLSTSGFVVLPWNYDAAMAAPSIQSIASAADPSAGVAPGGLFAISGTNLNPLSVGTSDIPLPTALADSCMTINGDVVPLLYVSPDAVRGQIPFTAAGAGTLVLRTPSGVSNDFQFMIEDQAPAIFSTQVKGWTRPMPVVVRTTNGWTVTPTNPLHPNDWFVIYATGLGAVAPFVPSGQPGPSDPLAQTIAPVTVTLGGTSVPVFYSGLAPGQVGVYQINARLPFKGLQDGMQVPLTITQGAYKTTVYVRVVKP